jgi:predicted CXXCH cytochrome family protein
MAAKSIRVLLILFVLSLAGSALGSEPKQDQAKAATALAGKAEPAASTRPSDPNLYAGTDTCISCHEDIGKSHEKGPHSKTDRSSNGPAFKGCEGCHGAGKAHAEGGGDTTRIIGFRNLSRADSTRTCLDCHGQDEEHANFLQSRHAKRNVGCLDCHSSHKAKVQQVLLKNEQPQLCYGCHPKVKPDGANSSHYKAKEGTTVCTSCHNVHGANQSAPAGRPASRLSMPASPAELARQRDHSLAEVADSTGEITTLDGLRLIPQPVFIPNNWRNS